MKDARWIQRTHLFRPDEYICSACRAVSDRPYMVCPSCGKQMSKTKHDSTWADEAESLSVLLDDDW